MALLTIETPRFLYTMDSLDMISISTQKQFFITKLVLLNLEVRCISNEQGIVVL
jgi:hypothetical protein